MPGWLLPALQIGGGLLGGIFGDKGQQKAAKALGNAANQSNSVLTDTYNKGLGYLQPYSDLGQTGIGGLQKLVQGDYSGFENSPDYLWAQKQGQQGLDRSAAANGRLFSGGHQADTMAYNQGLASQYLNNYRSSLGQLVGFGQNASNNMASLGQNYANSYGDNLMTAAGARANALSSRGNMLSDLATGIGGSLANFYGGKSASPGASSFPSYAPGSGGFAQWGAFGPDGSGWGLG